MTTKQQNFANMAHVTYNKLQSYKSLWESIPQFAALVDELKTTLDEFATAEKESKIVTTGSTADKSGAKQQAIDAVVKISGPAAVYALNTNNLTLYNQINTSKSDLKRVQDGALAQQLHAIIDEIEKIVDALADYGLSPQDVADAKTKTEAYDALVNHPRELITKRATKIESLADYIDLLRNVLTRIDNMMRLFDGSEFYRDYKNARKIVDLGGRSTSGAAPAAQ